MNNISRFLHNCETEMESATKKMGRFIIANYEMGC